MLKFASRVPPYSSKLAKVRESGFQYAEIFLTSKSIKEWKLIAEAAESCDLGYGLHFPNRPALNDKQLEKTIKLYRRLNCESMVIHRPMFRDYSEQLLEIDSSLCLAVENHRLKPKSFWRWAETYQYLTLDVEHLWKHTLKQAPFTDLLTVLKKFLKQHGSQVKRVHLPGYEPGGNEHQPLSFNPQLARKVFTALSKINFQGLVVSETRPSMRKLKFLKNDVLLFESWEKHHLKKIRRKQQEK